MPTYEYICDKCGHQFDFSQSIKDDALKTCPEEKCKLKKWGKGKVKRAIGKGAGIIFKGSGFYITDYRSESYKEAAKKEASAGEAKSGGETKSTEKSGGGGEAKPASKAESKKPSPKEK
jgi:putative FmdB family regulatory protein